MICLSQNVTNDPQAIIYAEAKVTDEDNDDINKASCKISASFSWFNTALFSLCYRTVI